MRDIFSTLAGVLSLVLATTSVAAQQPGPNERGVASQALSRRFETAVSDLEKKHAAASALQMAREADLQVEGLGEMRLYLVAAATEALASEGPFPLAFDAEGRSLPNLSQEFVSWAVSAGLDPEVAAWAALRERPVEIARLIGDTDPSVLALFDEALGSQNHLVALMGAWGLAVVNHSESIDHIGTVAEAAPSEIALALADVLDQFADPAAHARAEEIRIQNP